MSGSRGTNCFFFFFGGCYCCFRITVFLQRETPARTQTDIYMQLHTWIHLRSNQSALICGYPPPTPTPTSTTTPPPHAYACARFGVPCVVKSADLYEGQPYRGVSWPCACGKRGGGCWRVQKFHTGVPLLMFLLPANTRDCFETEIGPLFTLKCANMDGSPQEIMEIEIQWHLAFWVTQLIRFFQI